eukprot:1158893-Pelagomonas_calceolata.AAC.23
MVQLAQQQGAAGAAAGAGACTDVRVRLCAVANFQSVGLHGSPWCSRVQGAAGLAAGAGLANLLLNGH